MRSRRPVVVTRLMGGLGNQMFQYAAGLAVADRLDGSLLLHAAQPLHATERGYALDCFRLSASFASWRDVPAGVGGVGTGGLGCRVLGLLQRQRAHRCAVITQAPEPLDQRVFEIAGSVYLDGYWQSEAYFDRVASQVRSLFTSWRELSAEMAFTALEIERSSSIAVHVRRGDYAHDQRAKKVHGLCASDYYVAGVEAVLRRRGNARAFMFSDEPEWCRQHLDLGVPVTYVKRPAISRDWEHLALMSMCRDHVISNSTFSWWSAWLGSASDKMVIAPRRWFAEEERNARASMILPAGWIAA